MNEHATDPSVTTSAPSPTGLPKRSRGLRAAQDEVPPEAGARARPDRLERALSLARRCARIAEDNRAKDIVVLDMTEILKWVDYLVICTGASGRQIGAIADECEKAMGDVGDEKIGVAIVVKALEAPIRQIASNCGTDGAVVADEVRQKGKNIGYDANTGEYVDMFKAGIIDPVKVVKNALLNASSIAGLMLTTSVCVTRTDEPGGEKKAKIEGAIK